MGGENLGIILSFYWLEGVCHGATAYIAQRSSNVFGSFLYLTEFRGCGRRGLLIIPEEVKGDDWKKMMEELRLVCGYGEKIVE